MSIYYHGVAIPVFSIQPNWNSGFRAKEQWPTVIRESLDTSEERLLLGARPYYKLTFSTLCLTAQETGYIRKILEGTDTKPVAVPFWPLVTYLSADCTAGNLWVDVETTANRMFEIFPNVILWRAFNDFEALRRFSVATTQIGFTVGTSGAWLTGEKIVPLLVGKLKKPRSTSLTDENGIFQVDFEESQIPEGAMLAHAITGTVVEGSKAFGLEMVGGPII